ncbi:GntR family transcriptional regulator [Rugosibacter aromaticivorans]|uniref:GntR family transcriptional regulator n=1 Tax=Rugosibacter aromaticivorans TaxID=1565605 RepID=A0A0C5J3Y5_9PROT|nr:GntR family transcriptional regulator [Rugosibacter aromaticivorans]
MLHSDANTLNAPALYAQVAERLRARIFAHELLPGSWIDEQVLAAEYGISRTPMREALKVLASEGLVTLKPRRGCYVTELSEQERSEVFPVMALLESRVAEDAARRATSADFSRLTAIHEELETHAAANDVDHFFETNQRFHIALQEIAGNRYLAQLINDTRQVAKLARRDSLRPAGRLQQSLQEHRAILEALLARDAALAGQRMHSHLLSGGSVE